MTTTTDSHFYQHSGRTGFSIPLILGVGLPISIILAGIYAYVVRYCPVIGYVNVVFLGAYVWGTSYVLTRLAKLGKCRNRRALFLLGCLAGLVGLYFSWIFFFKALFGNEVPLIGMILNPGGFWRLIVEINKEGWWGPSGVFQWALCGIEGVVFVFGVGFLTSASIDREVFCEDCGTWCNSSNELRMKLTEEYAKSLDGSGFNHLDILKLPETTEEDYPNFSAEILQCTGCQLTNAVRIKLHTAKIGKDDSVEIEAQDIPGILLQKSQPSH